MTTTLVLQIDDSTKFRQILNLAKQLHVPFRYDTPQDEVSSETNTVVWDWDDADNASYALSIETFAEDWNSEADKVWDNA